MQIAGLLKTEKIVEVQGKKLAIKRYPLGFYDFLQIKALEGKNIKRDDHGRAVWIEDFGNYEVDFYVDQLINGLVSWDLSDENGYAIPLTREACQTLVQDYAEFAGAVLKEISAFNTPIIDKPKKK